MFWINMSALTRSYVIFELPRTTDDRPSTIMLNLVGIGASVWKCVKKKQSSQQAQKNKFIPVTRRGGP
jgi:hypothetical protein